MKQTLIACILVASAWGCGSNNSNTGANANGNCAVGQTWNGTSCVATSAQNCQLGSYWNTAINQCSPNPINAQTSIYPAQPNQAFPGQNQNNLPALAPTSAPGAGLVQDCGAGQYWAGRSCAIELNNTPGVCAGGQIGTVAYGCVQRSSVCANQYSYLDGSECLPAPIVRKKKCKFKHRHSTSTSISVDGEYSTNCFSIDEDSKVKRRGDGSMKKIKTDNYKAKFDKNGNLKKIKYYN